MDQQSGNRSRNTRNVAEEAEMWKKRARIENYMKERDTKIKNDMEAYRITKGIPAPEQEEIRASFIVWHHPYTVTTGSMDTSTYATIHIGTDDVKQIFRVSKDMLSIKSRVFATMVNGRYTYAKNPVVRLPEDYPKVFLVFLNWVRSGRFSINNSDDKSAIISFLIEVYIFADKYDIIGLLDQAMTVSRWLVRNYADAYPTEEHIEHIKKNCMESSGLYKFIARIIDTAYKGHSSKDAGLISNESQSIADRPNADGTDDKLTDSDKVTDPASRRTQKSKNFPAALEEWSIGAFHRHVNELPISIMACNLYRILHHGREDIVGLTLSRVLCC